MSPQEKKNMLMAWFHQNHDFYTLKQIEKDGSKASKIPGMQMKDVLQELLDDDLLNCEKCGNTNLYWSFKFDFIKQQNDKYDRLTQELDKLKEQIEKVKKDITSEQDSRQAQVDGVNRDDLVVEYDNCVKKYQQLSDAKTNAQIKPQLQNLVRGIDAYTDAIECLISYFKNTGVNEKMIKTEFEIPESFEDPPIV